MPYFFRVTLVLLLIALVHFNGYSQLKETSKWKALFALGINYPNTGGFVNGTFANPVNFPTVNLGVQHMFKQAYGVKLDYGFNRFKNDNESPEFKINYSRINAQFVYDPTYLLGFIPRRMRTILHAGPGYSIVKPLGNLGTNEQSYLNFLIGLELHYSINEKVSVYADTAYIFGFTSLEDYNPAISGLGAFNGNLFNFTIGLAVSLSGCQYCD